MIKALIIDDEPSSIHLTSDLLSLYSDRIDVCATGNSVEEGYALIGEHRPQLVLLDVNMDDGTGFDLLNKFDRIDFKVIFITAHNEYVLKALRYSALDYLLKPISPLEFSEAIRKSLYAISHDEINFQMKALLHNLGVQQSRKIVLKTQEKIYSVEAHEIVRLEAEGSYTTVYLGKDKKIIVSRLIKDFEEILSEEGFIRVHQSHLVNRQQIFYFQKQDSLITMKDGSTVPVSTRKKDMVLQLMQTS